MNKSTPASTVTVFCGIDVSARTLAVAVIAQDQPLQQREFANSASGHKALLGWLGKHNTSVRVSLEATGTYSLDLALALDASQGVEVAVLNPKLVNRFAQTLRRSKTDAADALVLAEYSQRMPFTAWQRPNGQQFRLRAMGRYVESLTTDLAEVKNRLHIAESTSATPRAVILDLKQAQAALERRLTKMRREAMKLIQDDEVLRERFALLVSIPGIAEVSALQIMSELVLLPAGMTVRQWMAYSGLDPGSPRTGLRPWGGDPVHQVSGSSVHKPSRISRAGNRHLRRALFMPTLSAVRFDPYLRAFYQALRQRHKTGLQALMAVERKLLHAIYGIFKSGRPYDGRRLFPQIQLAVESIAG